MQVGGDDAGPSRGPTEDSVGLGGQPVWLMDCTIIYIL